MRNSPTPPDQPYGDYQQPQFDDEDDFVVELPAAFETAPAAPPQQPVADPYPGSVDGPPGPLSAPPRTDPLESPQKRSSRSLDESKGGGGISGVGAFFLGMLAQLILLGALGIILYLTPEPTGRFLTAAQSHFSPEEETPVTSEWAPSIEVDTDVVARMEILELEDRAIYGQERIAWDELVRQAAILNPADLTYDSVQASLSRIRLFYELGGKDAPDPLDARAIFPGKTSESELPDTALIQVLRDKRQPSETRRRAAYLLADSNTPSAALALVDTIQDDPNLEVVKQSFASFRGATGYPGEDFFDAPGVQSWWDINKAGILGQN